MNTNTSTATGLSAGGYDVTVTDANGCEEVASITISDPTGVELVVPVLRMKPVTRTTTAVQQWYLMAEPALRLLLEQRLQ